MPNTKQDKLLHELLKVLARRGIAKKWSISPRPHSDLLEECQKLLNDPAYKASFLAYLEANPIVRETVETTLAAFSMSTMTKWQDVPMPAQILARRGWHINRWLPTFLLVKGPLGYFFTKPASPLNALLKQEHSKYRTLAYARDVLNHDLFRRVRNGVAHWSFFWKETAEGSLLMIINEESGAVDAEVALLEAEALHLVAFTTVEILDRNIFSPLVAGLQD